VSLEYSFWEAPELVVYGVQAEGRMLIPEFVKTLRAQGKTVHLVDPRGGQFQGEPVHTSMDAVDGSPGSALIVVEAERAQAAVAECADAGITEMWIDTRGDSSAAAATARDRGVGVVEERCPMLTMPGGHIVHRFHAGLLRLVGKLPKS
jgi:predicted CoA-binding protein